MVVEQRMTPRLSLFSKAKGAVGVDIDGADRVHLDGDF